MRPLFPQQQTSLGSVGTSVWCHKRTHLRQADLVQMPQGAIAKCLRIANPGSESYIDELAPERIFQSFIAIKPVAGATGLHRRMRCN